MYVHYYEGEGEREREKLKREKLKREKLQRELYGGDPNEGQNKQNSSFALVSDPKHYYNYNTKSQLQVKPLSNVFLVTMY